jgi:hypothetical protein
MLALGQALHWLHTEAGPFPFRWPFGHRAVSDGFGLLLASLLTHPGVLRDRGLPVQVAGALAGVAQRSRLLHLRTLAALLARTPCGPETASEPYAAYAEAIGLARGVPVSEQEAQAWPLRVEATYAAETLQSWLLAAALRRELRHKLGDGWWKNAEVGPIWHEWQKPGQRLSVSELIASIGSKSAENPLDPGALTEWLHEEG